MNSYSFDENCSSEFEIASNASKAVPLLTITLQVGRISELFARVVIYWLIPSLAISSENTILEQCEKFNFLLK